MVPPLAQRSTVLAITFGASRAVPEPSRASTMSPGSVVSDASPWVSTTFRRRSPRVWSMKTPAVPQTPRPTNVQRASRNGVCEGASGAGEGQAALAVGRSVVREVAVARDLEEVARQADAAVEPAAVAAVERAAAGRAGGDRDVHALDVGRRRVGAERPGAVLRVE